MTEYFDPHVTARSEGFNRGLLDGESFGREQGLREGYDRGRADGMRLGKRKGYDEGWSAAVQVANVNIRKQQEFTGKHVADKKKLQAQVDEQRKLIAQLTERLDDMERENAQLKVANTKLRDVVTALKGANERLRAEVADLDTRFAQQTDAYANQVANYNRNMVFMKSVKSVVEDLGDSKETNQQVQALFAKRYQEHVAGALSRGTIKVPLDKDEAFAKEFPKLQRFILDMLSAAEAKRAPQTPGPESSALVPEHGQSL